MSFSSFLLHEKKQKKTKKNERVYKFKERE